MAELLAPCGGKDSFFAAINYGCDAVYLGLDDFSARKNADNFNAYNIGYFVSYAHTFNVKVYVCVNTIVKNSELNKFFSTVNIAYSNGCDAFIVQDIFLGKKLKELFPEIVMHLSTQSGICNVDGAKLALDYGFSRVVLARETQAKEIEEISKIIETEIFVHGALCSSLSGHCYMSSFIGGNSGNRGFCRQPCRKKYSYSFNNNQCYALSLSDLCLVDDIEKLQKLGVCSFKIEGRMRSSEYVASTVKLYREAIDSGKVSSENLSLSRRAFNRGNFCKGYVFGEDKNLISSDVQGNLGEFVEKIAKFESNKIVLKNKCFSGSGYKILRNNKEVGNAICKQNGNLLDFSGKLKVGDEIFVTKDTSLLNVFNYIRLKEIEVEGKFFVGKKAELKALGISVFSDEVLESAKNCALTKNELLDNLSKRDIYPFSVVDLKFETDQVFMPKSKINSMRKQLFDRLLYSKQNAKQSVFEEKFVLENKTVSNISQSKLAIIISDLIDLKGIETNYIIFAPKVYLEKTINEFFVNYQQNSANKYLYIPPFLSNIEISKIEEICSKFDGFYVESISGIKLAQRCNKNIFGGLELNAFNDIDRAELSSLNVENYAISKELSAKEIFDENAFVLTFGSIKLMNLIYCPNKRNCKDCKVEDKFSLTDYDGRVFPVRRYKIGECRFEIFNESTLISKTKFKNNIFDLSGYDYNFAQRLLDEYTKGGFEAVSKKYEHTSGNLLKGIL